MTTRPPSPALVPAPLRGEAGEVLRLSRRRLILCAVAAPVALGVPAFVRHARAAEDDRYALGVGSGHPRPDGMVLWTRLTGEDLPDAVEVAWEVAHDEAFGRIAARGVERAEARWAHSVHAEPRDLEAGRWYWYRFTARGARSPAGRTRTAPAPADDATLRCVIASCQRYDHGHYAAWRHATADAPDLVLFLGDYIYEYPYVPGRVRPHRGGYVRTLDQYRARYAQYKSDPHLQAAHAAAPWLPIWDDHEVENDYAGLQGQFLQPGFAAQRGAAYRAWWEHQPVPKAARPRGARLRLHDRLDWGALARIHLLDGRQHRDPQACPRPGRGGSNVVPVSACPELTDPKRTLLGASQEAWLAAGWDTGRSWNLVAQQTLMAPFSWSGNEGGGVVWTDGWSGYPAARQRLLDGIAARRLGGAVVLGGDVHSHYVADLKRDVDDPKAPVLATEFCGTSVSSLSSVSQARIDAALPLNPHIRYARSDRRGYLRLTIDRQRLQADLRTVRDALDADSDVDTAASFVVRAGRPGAQRA